MEDLFMKKKRFKIVNITIAKIKENIYHVQGKTFILLRLLTKKTNLKKQQRNGLTIKRFDSEISSLDLKLLPMGTNILGKQIIVSAKEVLHTRCLNEMIIYAKCYSLHCVRDW